MADRARESVTGYVTTTPKIELDDPEIVAWLSFAIGELERKAPLDALQFPPAVARTFGWVKRLHLVNQEAALRAFERIENATTTDESGATVEPMTTAEAAVVLGVTPTRVAQMAKAGAIEATKVGRRWRIDRASLEANRARRNGGDQ